MSVPKATLNILFKYEMCTRFLLLNMSVKCYTTTHGIQAFNIHKNLKCKDKLLYIARLCSEKFNTSNNDNGLEVTQWLKVPVAFAEDLSSIPRTPYQAAQSYL